MFGFDILGAGALADSFQSVLITNGHVAVTLENAKFLGAISKNVIIPCKGSESVLTGCVDHTFVIVLEVLHLCLFIVVGIMAGGSIFA